MIMLIQREASLMKMLQAAPSWSRIWAVAAKTQSWISWIDQSGVPVSCWRRITKSGISLSLPASEGRIWPILADQCRLKAGSHRVWIASTPPTWEFLPASAAPPLTSSEVVNAVSTSCLSRRWCQNTAHPASACWNQLLHHLNLLFSAAFTTLIVVNKIKTHFFLHHSL